MVGVAVSPVGLDVMIGVGVIGVSEGTGVVAGSKVMLPVDVKAATCRSALASGVLVGVGVKAGSSIQPTTNELASRTTNNNRRKRICNQASPALFSTNP